MTWRALTILAAAAAPALCQNDHPDLQGIWTSASVVPLERPASLKGKEFYTEQEAAENAKHVLGMSSWERLGGQAPEHYNMSQYGLDLSQVKVASTLRTSLIVGPDGRVPPFTPEAEKRNVERAARNRVHQFDGPENRPLQERCLIYSTEGPPMLPSAYNSNLQIVQDAEHVAILQEMIHSARVIPTDGSPHLPPGIRQWWGDSRGHWEGKTLVVDTTNFTDLNPFPGAQNLHVIERIRRTDEDTILYEFTVEDPGMWTKPWSGEVPIKKLSGQLYEYACHEANYGLANTLRGARVAEAEAVAKKAAQ